MTSLSVVLGLIFLLILPGWGVALVIAYAAMCAWESGRLRTRLQVNDWRWEHDLASLRRAAYRFGKGPGTGFLRPRKYHELS